MTMGIWFEPLSFEPFQGLANGLFGLSVFCFYKRDSTIHEPCNSLQASLEPSMVWVSQHLRWGKRSGLWWECMEKCGNQFGEITSWNESHEPKTGLPLMTLGVDSLDEAKQYAICNTNTMPVRTRFFHLWPHAGCCIEALILRSIALSRHVKKHDAIWQVAMNLLPRGPVAKLSCNPSRSPLPRA